MENSHQPDKTKIVTPERERAPLASVPTGLLINGQWREASDQGTFGVEDPATGVTLLALSNATSEDALAALTAADQAQSSWARTPARERSEILRRAFDLVTERAMAGDKLALPYWFCPRLASSPTTINTCLEQAPSWRKNF